MAASFRSRHLLRSRELNGLVSMESPANIAHLQQFICALLWVKQALFNVLELEAPLHNLMGRACDHTAKRTKRAVSRILLASVGWRKTEMGTFKALKKTLAEEATLAKRDASQRVCVYTEASGSARGGYHYPSSQIRRSSASMGAAARASILPLRKIRQNPTELVRVVERGLCGHEHSRLHALDRGHSGRLRTLHGPQQSSFPLRPSGRSG